MRIIKITLATLIILFTAGSAIAQDRKPISQDEQSMYVVSAKAGLINVIEGDLSYMRDKAAWSKLTSGDELREGDTVKTGRNSRAEILLTPGCYLRLDENTEFILSDTSVNRFKIDILEGSALVEASVVEGTMTVATPKAEFSIIQKGLYRFNVAAGGRVEAAVRKGKIAYGNTIIKGGKKAVVDNSAFAIASYDKNDTDIFDRWSKNRAESLLAVNRSLSNRNIRRSALSLVFVSSTWIRDSRCGCYTFLPFGSGFSSPYGGDYSVCNPFYYRPRPYDYERGGLPGRPVGGGGNSGGGGNHGGYPGGGGNSGGGGGHSGGGGGGVTPRPSEPPPRFDPGERGRWSDSGRERPQPVNNGGRRP